MIDPQAVVFARLTADATLTALLLSYAAAPAVFEDGKAPAGAVDALATLPLALVTPATNQANPKTFDAKWREERVDVRLYHKPAGSSLPLQQAAERVRVLFDDYGPASITSGSVVNATVSGPFPAPTDDPSLDGRIVQLTLLIKET